MCLLQLVLEDVSRGQGFKKVSILSYVKAAAMDGECVYGLMYIPSGDVKIANWKMVSYSEFSLQKMVMFHS